MRVPPQRAHPCSQKHYGYSKSCSVEKWQTVPGQVGFLISALIIMMLLNDTGLSPTATGPGETFDSCCLDQTCPWAVLLFTSHLCSRGETKHLRPQSQKSSLEISAGPYHCFYTQRLSGINVFSCLLIVISIWKWTCRDLNLISDG